MSLLVMVVAVCLMTSGHVGDGWPRTKRLAMALAALNGVVGVALQLRGVVRHSPPLPALAPFEHAA